jgi:predicted membrane-bound spermidine synthase
MNTDATNAWRKQLYRGNIIRYKRRDYNTIIVKEFNILLSSMEKSSRQNIN